MTRRAVPGCLGGRMPVFAMGALVTLGLVVGCSSKDEARSKAKSTQQARRGKQPGPPTEDAQKTASGLVTKVLQPGRGDRTPQATDEVRVHYIAWNEKGRLSEDTRKDGKPVTFDLTSVIAGLSEGLQLMKRGEQRRLWIPDALAYPGRPGTGPRPDLVYDIELLEILEGPPSLPAPAEVATPPTDAKQSESGLAYRWLHRGDRKEKPNAWDHVRIEYAGWTVDGEMFDSSAKLGRPAIYDMADVIPGWVEALQRMTPGDRMRLWVPEALAYGSRLGRPRGPLLFELELVSIDRRPEPPRAPAHVAAPPKSAKQTDSGLAYRVLQRGESKARPGPNSRVKIHYSGWTTNGELFDSSVVRGHPATVPLDRVIPGWTEGLQQMAPGDKYLFWIPEELAYHGRAGSPAGMLVYEIELLEILP